MSKFPVWVTKAHEWHGLYAVIKRFEDRCEEMLPVYDEIDRQLSSYDHEGRNNIISAFIDGANYCNPVAVRAIKESDKALKENQSDIIKTTKKLIKLLQCGRELNNEGFSVFEGNVDLFHLINEAGLKTGTVHRQSLFKNYIVPSIKQIKIFDGKYTPTLEDVLSSLIEEVNKPISCYAPEIDASIFIKRETSSANFVRFLLWNIEQGKRLNFFPSNFSLSNKSIATVTNCALDSDIDEDNVKKYRQDWSKVKTQDQYFY